MVIVILAVMWICLLLPPWLRGRAESRPTDSVRSFRRQLTVLEKATPGYVAPKSVAVPTRSGGIVQSISRTVPAGQRASVMSRSQAYKRRREIVTYLAGAAVLSLALVPFTRTSMLLVHLVIDALLVAYLGLLARARHIAAEREVKLRYLPQGGDVADPVRLLQQMGGSRR